MPASDASTANILCAVETYRRPILIKRKDGDKAEEAAGYSIASVFTAPQNRGKGYAGQMMRILHQKIKDGRPIPGEPADSPMANALSFLYSDVGPDFYARHGPMDDDTPGWQVTGLRTTRFDALALAAFLEGPVKAEALYGPALFLISMSDQRLLESELVSPDVAAPAFVVLPTPGTYQWIRDRADHWELAHGRRRHQVWGFSIGQMQSDDFSFVLFTYEGQKGYLRIVRMRIAPGQEHSHGPELLRRVGQVAVEKGFEKVVSWQVPQTILDAVPEAAKGDTADRTDSLSALKTYGGESNMNWMVNEGYAWC